MGTTRLANNQVVTSTASFSQAINMAGSNALSVQLTCLGGGGTGSLAVAVTGSNDLENWSNTNITVVGGTGISITNPTGGSVGQGNYTTIGYAYVRLAYTGPSTTVIAVDVNTYQL